MNVKNPDPVQRVVEDYDFTFASGQSMPLTIDKAAGDTVSFDQAPLAIVVKLTAKPSLSNPDVLLPEEEITIFMNQLLAIQKRSRVVTGLTYEQEEELRETFKSLVSKSVN